jgi:ATP synthase protein I
MKSFSPSLKAPSLGPVLLAEAVLLTLATGFASWYDADAGKAVFLGGLIFLLPHGWFAWRVFRRRGAGSAREVAQGFYRAETGKFLLTAAGFALAFNALGSEGAAWLMGSFAVMLLLNSVLLAASRAV